MLPWWRIDGLLELLWSNEVSAEVSPLALVLENLHFRYVSTPFDDESLQILQNLQSAANIEGIPISWVEAWETDNRRSALGEYIRRNNAERYEELRRVLGEERAEEELNSIRRKRVVDWELKAEAEREELEERNERFIEEFELEEQTQSENEGGR